MVGAGQTKKIMKVFFLAGFLCSSFHAFAHLSGTYGDFQIDFWGTAKVESFFGKNISLLNDKETADKVIYSRHVIDFRLDALYGEYLDTKYPAIEFNFTARNKARWGDPSSIARTTDAETQSLDEVSRPHRHFIPRHIFWMREAWLRLSLNQVFGLPAEYEHSFTVGAFPFKLGRGIALGSAFAVGPELLGFFSDSAVDQYAFGAKFAGDLLDNKALSYDLYASILDNKTGTLGQTGAKIRGQEYGRLECPKRGFGRMSYLFGAKLHWTVFDNQNIGSLFFEPYLLYNDDPEQKVEFLADAESKLGTFGLAGEYESERFAFGFDGAVNVGRQSVRGWDRNRVILQNRDGNVFLVNSHAYVNVDPTAPNAPSDLRPYLAPHATGVVIGMPSDVGRTAQNLINNELDSAQRNGRLIGTADGFTSALGNIPMAFGPAENDQLFNDTNRFRDPYINRYKGAMFVGDAALYFFNKELELATSFGYATGDDNPNNEVIDGDFTGFISLQEVYSGKRVRSAFLLGGAGRVSRPLAAPTSNEAPSPFARVVSRFTDLIFCGASIKWEPTDFSKEFRIHPNLLLYWKENRVPKFDAETRQQLDECADSFLGAEINLFADLYLYEHLKLYFVGSVFIPGGHYDDIRGIPLSSEQSRALNRLDRTGFSDDRIPNLGNDTAFTVNVGLEFKF